ncbi:hypothetical protein O181_124078 [Austropuccinia psidii MF-1]|uniref:Copia protein n=1 Tax=Austropuccinia psidii MF-1 TaxID=1389203 RepID=A0A9Q3KMZ1_9BASI|nr:hypothetical protein [Austropuccinia psidii MF-1]
MVFAWCQGLPLCLLGNCVETRRSVTGFLATLNGNVVLWKSSKQPLVSISTAEAEYKAVCNLASEFLWFKQCSQGCGLLEVESPILIHEDNQGFIKTINGNFKVNRNWIKHIHIHPHFVKEAIWNGVFKLIYTLTNRILADFLTKSVNSPAITCSLQSLGVISLGVKVSVQNQDQNQFDEQSVTPILSKGHGAQS